MKFETQPHKDPIVTFDFFLNSAVLPEIKALYLIGVHFRDHPFKTSACLRGEGYPHVSMVKRLHYIRIKNPLHKYFAGMPMVGG